MRHRLRHTFYAMALTTTPLFAAQVDQENIGSSNAPEQIQQQAQQQKPYNISGLYDWVGSTKVTRKPCHGNIKFATGEVEASGIYYYDPCYEEGLSAAFGYGNTHMFWNHNPYFRNQKYWNTFLFNLGAFTKRADGWLWLAQVQMNMDTTHWNFDNYTTYDFFIWGRYDYLCDVGVHFGFIAETGMKIDHVLPIIGFDWKYNDQWKINAVFPMNISLVYQWTCNLQASIAGRYFDTRQRAGKNEPKPRSLFYYRAGGIEGALTWSNEWISANAHAGYVLGGNLRIGNRQWREKKNIGFDGAPYAGGELKVSF